jgi:hypothetical protein
MDIYQETLNALSDEEMKDAVRELKAFDEQGTEPSGALHRVIVTLEDAGRYRSDDVLGITRYALYAQAAHRWAGV